MVSPGTHDRGARPQQGERVGLNTNRSLSSACPPGVRLSPKCVSGHGGPISSWAVTKQVSVFHGRCASRLDPCQRSTWVRRKAYQTHSRGAEAFEFQSHRQRTCRPCHTSVGGAIFADLYQRSAALVAGCRHEHRSGRAGHADESRVSAVPRDCENERWDKDHVSNGTIDQRCSAFCRFCVGWAGNRRRSEWELHGPRAWHSRESRYGCDIDFA